MADGSIWNPYDLKVIDVGTHFEIRSYIEPMFRLKEGCRSPFIRKAFVRGESHQFRIDSLIRSWTNMSQLAYKNQHVWKSFITLTFKKNVTDLTVANRMLNMYCSSMARSCKELGFEFKYIGVPEFQERGAVHYHLVTNVVPGSVLMPRKKRIWKKDKKTGQVRYLDYYDLKHWPKASYGFSSAFGFESVDDKFTVVGYLAKYFFKGMRELSDDIGRGGECDNRLFNRVKLLRSRNLERPDEHLKMLSDYDAHEFLDYWESQGDLLKEIKRTSDNPNLPDLTIRKFQKKSLTI